MWNVFDFSFIIVFLAYLGFRIKGLIRGDGNFLLPVTDQSTMLVSFLLASSSELGFDILACAACILFPRMAFFAISNNVIVL
jgi:hypothetical protein